MIRLQHNYYAHKFEDYATKQCSLKFQIMLMIFNSNYAQIMLTMQKKEYYVKSTLISKTLLSVSETF